MTDRATASMQWHNTEACMDFSCECGADTHLDGGSTGQVQCPRCSKVWVLEVVVHPRYPFDFQHEPTMLTEDDAP